MTQFRDNPFEGQLEVITTIRERVIAASVAELKQQDELTRALRESAKQGVGIDELSEASGLSPKEIRRRIDSELVVESDLDTLVGIS